MARERSAGPWRSREEGSLLLGSVLWLVDHLGWLWRAFGVEVPIFRELLRTRILLDLRPTSSTTSTRGVVGIALTVLMTWMAGLGTGLIALLAENGLLWVAGSQGVLLLLLAFVLFQQLAGMLVDPTDIQVVAPHPVPDRTLFAVRLAQVFAYVLVFAVSFTAGNVLLAVFAQPPLAVLLVFPVLSLLCTLTTLGGVAFAFALVLRLVGPAHFQRVTMWLQILGAVLLMLALQIGPRLVPVEPLEALWLAYPALRLLLPPYLYALTFELACGTWSPLHLAGALGALLLPALALVVTLRLASRYFIAGLEGTLELGRRAAASWPGGAPVRIGRALVIGEQRAGYDHALALSRREPHVLRGALPQCASFLILALASGTGLGSGARGGDLFLCLSAGILAFVVPTVLELCQGTAAPGARWIFEVAPLRDESELLRGGVKALLLLWYGAGLVVVGLVQLLVAGPGALARILLALALSANMALFFARRFALGIPFTREIRKMENVANLGIALAMGLGLAVLAAVYFALTRHPIALGVGLVSLGALLVRQWRGIDRMQVAEDRRLEPARGVG